MFCILMLLTFYLAARHLLFEPARDAADGTSGARSTHDHVDFAFERVEDLHGRAVVVCHWVRRVRVLQRQSREVSMQNYATTLYVHNVTALAV